jgi:hypothetical protein
LGVLQRTNRNLTTFDFNTYIHEAHLSTWSDFRVI